MPVPQSICGNNAGYTFTLTGVTGTPLVRTGAFTGTEFVDTFSDGNFYYTAQQFNLAPDLVSTISAASISIESVSVPEQTSASLLLAGGLGLIMRRRRK